MKFKIVKAVKDGVKSEIAEIKELKPTQAQRNISQALVKAVIMALNTQGIPAPSSEVEAKIVDTTSIVVCDLFSGITDTEKLIIKRIIKAYKAMKQNESEI